MAGITGRITEEGSFHVGLNISYWLGKVKKRLRVPATGAAEDCSRARPVGTAGQTCSEGPQRCLCGSLAHRDPGSSRELATTGPAERAPVGGPQWESSSVLRERTLGRLINCNF